MPSSLRMVLVGLVAFGLGFGAATLLPSESEVGLQWERSGDAILLTPSSQDRAYLVTESSEGLAPDGGEPDVTPIGIVDGYGTGKIRAGVTTRVYEVKPLWWCGDGECHPCGVRPDDDCPLPPPPPDPFRWLVHAELASK